MSIVLKLTLEISGSLAISLQMVFIQNAKKGAPNRNANSALLRATAPVVNASMWNRGEKKQNKTSQQKATPFADKSTSDSI